MRKQLRKYLPHPDKIRENRWLAMFGQRIFHPRLWHLNRHSAAGALAVGLFCGLIPGPFQMVAAAFACVALRVNLPLALLSTFYTNPLTIVPLYFVAFAMGDFVLGGAGGDFVAPPELGGQRLIDWAGQLVGWVSGLGKPLFVGLVLLASLLSAAGYGVVRLLWRWHLVRAWRRRAQRP